MTAVLSYNEVALSILTQSIKSAVFIDDKARGFYEAATGQLREEDLSVSLYESLKAKNISLAVHKFRIGDEKDGALKKYLFEDRDLVLLDWKLNDQDGELFSLRLLADVVKASHLHFCVIYTTEKPETNIINNILSFFSNKDAQYYRSVEDELLDLKESLQPYLERVSVVNANSNGRVISQLIRELGKESLDRIKLAAGTNDSVCALIKAKHAFSNFHKSEEELPCPDQIILESNSIIINNTVIIILNKDLEKDPNILLERITQQLIRSPFSFIQLLGFEMQNLFRSHSSFIDNQILNVSKDALLYHRNYVKNTEKTDKTFKLFIKNLLLEHATLGLRTSRLMLLENTVLDMLSEGKEPDPQELFRMNVFYNSRTVHSAESENDPLINFGDVFKGETGEYYLCITALCDCFRPTKIHNKYYFVKGQTIDSSDALEMGDSAFISFLPDGKVVSWVSLELADEKEKNIDHYQYKPAYIKPHQFQIASEYIKDKRIQKWTFEPNDEGLISTKMEDLIYITTIRSNYTQRIANHAFSHPVRVGVDFVKK